MSYSIEWNLAEFGRELNRYMRVSGETLVDVVNRKAWFIANKAMRFTPRANKAKILADMGARRTYMLRASKSKNPAKAGKVVARAKPIQFLNDTAVNIVQARRIKKGEKPLGKVEAKAAARKMINARARAIGTLRAGWHGMLKRLASVAGMKYGANVSSVTGGMRFLRGVGGASPANKRSIFNPTAQLRYRVMADDKKWIHPLVFRAANMAISAERGEMKKYAAQKLQQVNRRFAPKSP